MEAIQLQSINYDHRSEGINVIGFYSTIEKAQAKAIEMLKAHKSQNISDVLAPDTANYRYYSRIEYKSYYGNYNCAYEFVPIIIE